MLDVSGHNIIFSVPFETETETETTTKTSVQPLVLTRTVTANQTITTTETETETITSVKAAGPWTSNTWSDGPNHPKATCVVKQNAAIGRSVPLLGRLVPGRKPPKGGRGGRGPNPQGLSNATSPNGWL